MSDATASIRYKILTNPWVSDRMRSEASLMDECDLTLKPELDLFAQKKDEWRERFGEGKFVVVKGEEMVGPFDNPGTAYHEGIQQFGVVPFLIKGLVAQERTEQMPALTLGILHASPY